MKFNDNKDHILRKEPNINTISGWFETLGDIVTPLFEDVGSSISYLVDDIYERILRIRLRR